VQSRCKSRFLMKKKTFLYFSNIFITLFVMYIFKSAFLCVSVERGLKPLQVPSVSTPSPLGRAPRCTLKFLPGWRPSLSLPAARGYPVGTSFTPHSNRMWKRYLELWPFPGKKERKNSHRKIPPSSSCQLSRAEVSRILPRCFQSPSSPVMNGKTRAPAKDIKEPPF